MQISASTPQLAPQQTEALRSGVANGLRSVGEGLATASDQIGTAADKAYIYPVDSAFTLGRVISVATQNMSPKVHSYASKIGIALTYVAAYDNLMVSSMMRTPGATAANVLNMVANKIDGGSSAAATTASQGYSVGWGGLARLQAERASAAAATPPATAATAEHS